MVLPSELNQSTGNLPSTTGLLSDAFSDATAGNMGLPRSGKLVLWKSVAGVFALLWLLTLYFYFRRGPLAISAPVAGMPGILAEKELVKHIQQACYIGDASSVRKDLAQWIRNFAPPTMRGSMRDFGAACGDIKLQAAIGELDAYGFADGDAMEWSGGELWAAFNGWKNHSVGLQNAGVGTKPDLYDRGNGAG